MKACSKCYWHYYLSFYFHTSKTFATLMEPIALPFCSFWIISSRHTHTLIEIEVVFIDLHELACPMNRNVICDYPALLLASFSSSQGIFAQIAIIHHRDCKKVELFETNFWVVLTVLHHGWMILEIQQVALTLQWSSMASLEVLCRSMHIVL